MERVLSAYARYDAQTGYVQGMNFIVGALLFHCEESVAFWLFVALTEDYELREVYQPGLPGLYKRTALAEEMIERGLKDIHQHFVTILWG